MSPASASSRRCGEQPLDHRLVAEHRAALDRAAVSRPIARSGVRISISAGWAVPDASDAKPSSSPGAIAPPTKAPSWATQSNVVAVPRSTTIAGAPYRRDAASALASRSAPTSPGRSTRIGSGTVPAPAIRSGRSRRAVTASSAVPPRARPRRRPPPRRPRTRCRRGGAGPQQELSSSAAGAGSSRPAGRRLGRRSGTSRS